MEKQENKNSKSDPKKEIKFQEQPESKKQSDLISSISISLIQLVSENRSKSNYKAQLKAQAHSPFTSLSVPSISLSDYLHRIWKYSKMDESSLILGLRKAVRSTDVSKVREEILAKL